MLWDKDIKKLMRDQRCSNSFINEVVRMVGTRDVDWDDYGTQINTHEVSLTLINSNSGDTFKFTLRD